MEKMDRDRKAVKLSKYITVTPPTLDEIRELPKRKVTDGVKLENFLTKPISQGNYFLWPEIDSEMYFYDGISGASAYKRDKGHLKDTFKLGKFKYISFLPNNRTIDRLAIEETITKRDNPEGNKTYSVTKASIEYAKKIIEGTKDYVKWEDCPKHPGKDKLGVQLLNGEIYRISTRSGAKGILTATFGRYGTPGAVNKPMFNIDDRQKVINAMIKGKWYWWK